MPRIILLAAVAAVGGNRPAFADDKALERWRQMLAQDTTRFFALYKLLDAGAPGRALLQRWVEQQAASRAAEQIQDLLLSTLLFQRERGDEPFVRWLFEKSTEWTGRLRAAAALAARGDEAGARYLIDTFRQDRNRRRSIGQMIELSGARACIPPLIAMLEDPSQLAVDAHRCLQRLTAQPIPFALTNTPQARARESRPWKDWWQRAGAAFDPDAARLAAALQIGDRRARVRALAIILGKQASRRLTQAVRQLDPAEQGVALLMLQGRPAVRADPWTRRRFAQAVLAADDREQQIGRFGMLMLYGVDHQQDRATWRRWWAIASRDLPPAPAERAGGLAALRGQLTVLAGPHEGEPYWQAKRFFLERGERAIPLLIQLVEDAGLASDEVRIQAIQQLIDLEAAEVGPRLVPVLEQLLSTSGGSDFPARHARYSLVAILMEAVGVLRVEQGRAVLRRVFDRKGYPTLREFDAAVNLPRAAFGPLCHLKDPEALRVTRARLLSSEGDKYRLPGSISERAFHEAQARLELLGQPDFSFVYEAAEKIGDPGQAGALGALAHLRTPRAERALRAALADKRYAIRLLAVGPLLDRGHKPDADFTLKALRELAARWPFQWNTAPGKRVVRRLLAQVGRPARQPIIELLGRPRTLLKPGLVRFLLEALTELYTATGGDPTLLDHLPRVLADAKKYSGSQKVLARLLGVAADPRGASWLVPLLDQQFAWWTRVDAAASLARLGDARGLRALEQIVAGPIKRRTMREKVGAIRKLIELRRPGAGASLAALLSTDRSWHSRDRALDEALKLAGEHRLDECFDALSRWALGKLAVPDGWAARNAATEALLRYPWKRAGPVLLDLLRQERFNEAISRAIVRHPEPAFLPWLVRLSAEPWLGWDDVLMEQAEPPPAGHRALRAYGAQAAKLLIGELRKAGSAPVRARLLDAIENLPEASPPLDLLRQSLADPALTILCCRIATARSLDPGADLLLQLLRQPHRRIRVAAVRLAGKVGGKAVRQRLEELRKQDPRPSVRQAAARALEGK